MPTDLYIVIGRADDCDLVLSDRTVSSYHARLSWRGPKILVEDLGSANGTVVDGQKVRSTHVRPGAQLVFGSAVFDWSDKRLKPFLRRGAGGDTLLGVSIPGRRFICGSCGSRGRIPPGFAGGQLRCGKCDVVLSVGAQKRRPFWGPILVTILGFMIAGAVFFGMAWSQERDPMTALLEIFRWEERLEESTATSAQERAIQRTSAPMIVAAIDASNPTTRNYAVRLAAGEQGAFHVEQIARVWTHVREEWRYVNDPRGNEYFSPASETIDNEFVGDCDDFAIVLAAMLEAIGGATRVVMLDGDQGGHAYAEVCVPGEPEDTAQRLARYYRRHWSRYLGRQRVRDIHFRSSEDCPVWLNLDWNARVPGGAYGQEEWAVAVYPDGHTETLAAAAGPANGATVLGPSANAP